MAKILVVDDSLVARMSLKSCLPKDNHEIAEANDGAKGVAQFTNFAPDVTFMDLTMPGMDGIEALRGIKQINPAAIVIILTADIQKRTTEIVTELGAFAVLKKPPQRPEVQAIFEQALKAAGVV
ncbi:MAG: response regulator [Trichlorobacter sp.]|jgi:two-component system chemotaxis response regulator CheY|nr:response regulator [Trichlorobacter sp.]